MKIINVRSFSAEREFKMCRVLKEHKVNERFKFSAGEVVAISNCDNKVYRMRPVPTLSLAASCPSGYVQRFWLSWEHGEPVIECRFFRGEYVDECDMEVEVIGSYMELLPRFNHRGSDYSISSAFESCKFKFSGDGELYSFNDIVYYSGFGICVPTDTVKNALDIGYYSRMAKPAGIYNMVEVEAADGIHKDFENFITSIVVSEKFGKCRVCGKWHTSSNMRTLGRTRVCNTCYEKLKAEDGIVVCSVCGREELRTRSRVYRGRAYCTNCFRDIASRSINSYGYKPTPVFGYVGNDGEAKYCTRSESLSAIPFGLEWEFNNFEDASIAALDITEAGTVDEKQRVYCKHDGSLGSEGVECVFHPMTIDYMEKTDVLAKVANAAINNNVDDCPRHAGIHFHVPREKVYGINSSVSRTKALGKLDYFFATNKSKVVKFCRRTDLGYCMFPKVRTVEANESAESIFNKYYEGHPSDRYVAVNLENYATIEFRIFGTTVDPEVVKLYARYVDVLIDCVKLMDDEDFLKLEHEDVLSNVISKYYNDSASREKFDKMIATLKAE